jgi:hypothetical protein
MASQLKVDTLTGVTTAGSIVVTGEGNSTTTNLQQGLSKVWANLNGSSFGLRDNFNVTSATDNGTGDYTFTIATDMASGDYSLATNAGDNEVAILGCVFLDSASAPAAGSVRIRGTASNGSATDHTYVMIQITGDLA